MRYVDPYIAGRSEQQAQLARLLGMSLALHLLLFFVVVRYKAPLEMSLEQPFDPSQVVHISLSGALPRPDNRLPEKITTAPAEPQAQDDQAVSLPDEKAPDEAQPELPDPEPPREPEPPPKEQKTEEERPQPKPDQAKLDEEARQRMAALVSKVKETQPQQGDPNAAQGVKTRPPTSTNASQDSGGQGMTFSETSPEGRYLAEIKARVVDAWIVNRRLKKEQPDLQVVIEVTLAASGVLESPKIALSSGNESYDQSALRAVRIVATGQKFAVPPAKLKDQTVGMVFKAGEAK